MRSKTPTKVDQIYEEIERRLASGHWKVGDRLPTESDLAEEFGCSMGTVSKAIARFTHSYSGVLERRTRSGTQVLKDIRESPSGETSLDLDACAMIFPGEPHDGIWAIVRGFQQAAQAAGRRAVMLTTGPEVRKETEIIGRLAEFDVKGAVVYPIIPEPRDQVVFSQMVLSCRFPVVFADVNLPGVGCPAVMVDGFHAGYTMTRHLLDQGLRKIGFLANYAWVTSTRDRYMGFRHAMEEAGVEVDASWVCLDPAMHPNFGNPMAEPFRIARSYLRGCGDVEGVVCASDYLAVACLGVAREMKIEVPSALRVVGIDGFSVGAQSTPALTTYKSPHGDIGARAFELLNALINGAQPQVLETQLRGELIVRESG
jgi:GntR family transcriptional regulator of arabinose operon